MPQTINPKTIRQLREARGLTQDELAQRIKCAKDTVSRWERGANTRVRQYLKDRLCKALGVEWETLTKAPANPGPASSEDPVLVSARVRPETRNALQAVCERYGIDQRTVFEFAPLLFLIAAEKSLEHRRTVLAEVQDRIYAGYDALMKQAPYLGSYMPNVHATEAIEEERAAIGNRDIFRTHCYELNYDNPDPFVTFLNLQTGDLPAAAISDIFPGTPGLPVYDLAADTIDTMLSLDPLDDTLATNRIRGLITTGRIELRAAAAQRKALDDEAFRAWFEAEVEAGETELDRQLRDFFDTVVSNDASDSSPTGASQTNDEEPGR